MEDYTATELFELLNQQDECDWIEAKGGHESSHSVMETVCAYANEPSLGGGYILLGIAEDRSSYNCDTLKASIELRAMKSMNLLIPKGKGKGTYYVSGDELSTPPQELSTPALDLSTPPQGLSAPPQDLSVPPQISDALKKRISGLKQREHDNEKVESVIQEICQTYYVKAVHIAQILNRGEDYIKRKYLSPMIKDGKLTYRYPDMINHPEQAYKSRSQ